MSLNYNKTPESVLLSTPQAAEFLSISPKTLAKWRLTGEGPEFCKLGRRRVVYRLGDLLAFVEAGRRRSTSDPGPGGRSRGQEVRPGRKRKEEGPQRAGSDGLHS